MTMTIKLFQKEEKTEYLSKQQNIELKQGKKLSLFLAI